MTKRLFLFAGYDKDCIIDETLLHYLRALSELGDIVFVMDSDTPESEMAKVRSIKNVLHASAVRHNEYDFGSYKRAYQWAANNKILDKYDWVYLVNDSVYGPLFELSGILSDLESRGVDLTGMIDFTNRPTPTQVQSWFVGLSRSVANEPFLAKFMAKIRHESEKQLIVLKYEVGLSQVILNHGYKMSTYVSGENGDVCHSIYEEPIKMLKAGIPFLKKTALEALNGLQYLYPYTTDEVVDNIYKHAVRNKIPMLMLQMRAKYEKCFRLTMFGLPLFSIWRQHAKYSKTTSYKLFILDKIPVFKVSVTDRSANN